MMLADKNKKCESLYSKSYKGERFKIPMLASEFMAFSDAFNIEFAINYYLQIMLKKVIYITMLTDSLSLFEILKNGTITTQNA